MATKMPELWNASNEELTDFKDDQKMMKNLTNVQRVLKEYEINHKIDNDQEEVGQTYSTDGPYKFSKGINEWELDQPVPFEEPSAPQLSERASPFMPDKIFSILHEPRRNDFVRKLFNDCRNIPVYDLKMNQGVTKPLVGAIPQKMEQVAQEGDMVAALVHNIEQDKLIWMLAVVMVYNEDIDIYALSDIDPLSAANIKYMVPYDNVILLAHYRADPEIAPHALHKVGERVMAVCPRTTLFLIGIIKSQPATSGDDYTIVLHHTSFNNGKSRPLNIPQRLVVSMCAPQMTIHDKY